MRKLLCAMLILALLAVPVLALSVSAESAVDEDIILADLIPEEVNDQFEATDCEVKINNDGSMTIRITGASPSLKIKLSEGSTILTGNAVDLSDIDNNPAYVAVDFGTAGNVVFDHMILHYTRKDKPAGTYADLYLNSMCADNYAQYRKQMSDPGYAAGSLLGNGASYYTLWDWGVYVAKGDGKLNDDGRHQFVDMEIVFATGKFDTGEDKTTVGSEITFYTIAVVNDPEVELGTETPDPIEAEPDEPDESTDDPETSEDEPSDEPSADEPEESSTATSSEATSSTATSSAATSSTATSSTATSVTSTDTASSDGGLGTGAIVGIVIGAIAVIAIVVVIVVVVRKKK